MNANILHNLLEKSPREVAREVHKGQKYGDKDYFTHHLEPVAEFSEGLARKENYQADLIARRIRDLAYLHDAPEDTNLSGEIISFLFDEKLGNDAEILNKRHLNEKRKTKDEYFESVSDAIETAIVKTADRYMNIITLPQTETDKAIYLFQRYGEEFEYFKKYDIFPEIIYSALSDAHMQLILQEKISKNDLKFTRF
ncbi:hypothetical protein KGV55_00295 [Candidatus Gracilibacteria bacterium]|nr:hypothetical protein [Candidatus Gracilibacteria bacterium]